MYTLRIPYRLHLNGNIEQIGHFGRKFTYGLDLLEV